MALPILQLPSLPSSSSSFFFSSETLALSLHHHLHHHSSFKLRAATQFTPSLPLRHRQFRPPPRRGQLALFAGKEETQLRVSTDNEDADEDGVEDEVEDEENQKQQQQQQEEPTPEDLECINQIQRVLGLLKKNRDMLFSEVKLTISIEDPRDIERKRLLGIEDPDTPTRDDLADALEDVNEGRVPENRVALRMLADEMLNWPNLEVEAEKRKPSKSLYAKATNTGVDPKVAAKRLKVDWDSAAEIDDDGETEQTDLPSVVGFGALYLVSAFPIIIGVSVVLILFYNSLQ